MKLILLITILLALVLPATTMADGCILLETVDFLVLEEDGTSRFLLEGGTACGGGGGPTVFPVNKRSKIDSMMMLE